MGLRHDRRPQTPVVVSHSDAVMTRVKADLSAGDWRPATRRLRGYLVAAPECEGARTELVLIYRAAGCPQEAGRWGLLLPGVAKVDELVAFEAGCSARLTSDWTASMVRRAIRWPPGLTPLTAVAKSRLDQLDALAAQEQHAWQLAISPGWRRWIHAIADSLRGAT